MVPDIVHNYTKMCAPYSFRKGFGYGGSEEPSLEFVEAFEYVNDYDGSLKVTRQNGNRIERIEYDNLIDIFKDKDPRLAATVCLPGDKYQDGILEIRRGVSNGGNIPNVGESNYPSNMDSKIRLEDGSEISGIGKDGPYEDKEATKTGFYLRKFVVEDQEDYDKCTNPWPMFRLAEMYLNLAEAETELGNVTKALAALNMTRHRAGIHEITEAEVTEKKECLGCWIVYATSVVWNLLTSHTAFGICVVGELPLLRVPIMEEKEYWTVIRRPLFIRGRFMEQARKEMEIPD